MTASLIAVASGKGGVGKTFLSIALAQCFGRWGQRALLVDGDLGLANIDVQLGVSPRGDLMSVVAGGLALADAIAPYDGGADAGGFDVIAGRSGSGALRALPLADLAALGDGVKRVAAGYRRTVIDLGAGIDAATLDIAALAGRLLVVLTDEPTSLTDAYALVKIASRRDDPPRMAVAVNMAPSMDEGRRAYGALERACARFLGFAPPLAGIVRRDERVRDAIRAQTPFLAHAPAGPTADDIAGLAASLDAAFAQPTPPRIAERVR